MSLKGHVWTAPSVVDGAIPCICRCQCSAKSVLGDQCDATRRHGIAHALHRDRVSPLFARLNSVQGTGSCLHLASVLQEGRKSAHIQARSAVIRGSRVNASRSMKAIGMRDKVRSLPAFRKSDVFPDPRRPNRIWCRRDLARSKVPRAGSINRLGVSFVARVASSTRAPNERLREC
jgi:hypothetical protein